MVNSADLLTRPPAPSFTQAYPILYVDDEVDNLLVFRATFRSEFSILTAQSGADALELLEANDVAVLLTDQRMPAMTGVDLCERVRDLWPSVQRMLITAYSDRDVAIAAINRGGVSRYVTKPWDADQLRQTMHEAVARAHLERMVRRLRSSILDKERLVGAHAANTRLINDLAHTNASISACCAKLEELAPRLAGELDGATWSDYHSDVSELRRYVDFLRALERRGVRNEDGEVVRPQRQLIAVNGLLDTVVELVRHDVEGSARLSLHCPPAASLWADATDVSRMLINLVRSATAAMRAAGRRGCSIHIAVEDEGGSTSIRVSDDGPPLGAAEQRALLEGSQRDPRQPGVGVALELALTNGGQLDAVTASGSDRVAWQLTLPATEPSAPESR
jgi:two-component system sensor histidine kinase/response regulator